MNDDVPSQKRCRLLRAQRELRGRAAPSAMLQERFAPEDQAPTPRQRAFQTAMFLMLTMMLLDPPADPARRAAAPPAPAPLLPRDVAFFAADASALQSDDFDDDDWGFFV